MRILFFADNFRPETNAPATHIYERCRLWVREGHEVTVITGAPNFPEGKIYDGFRNRLRSVEMMDGIRVVRVITYITANKGFLRRTLDYVSFVPSAVFFALMEPRPDVVISSSPQLFVAVAGVAYARFRKLPHVFELRDLWPASILATTSMQPGKVYERLERLELSLYRKSRRVLAFTESFAEDLASRGIEREKIDVVINGTSLDLFSPVEHKDHDLERQLGLAGRFVVGYLGTLGLAHGLENVLAAAEALADQGITFLFVGSGAAEASLKAAASNRGLSNVVFVPRRPKEEISRYWSLCDVALVHLRNDPLFATVIPSKIFEAMAVGLPILYVGPPGEGQKIVERHGAGLITPPDEPQQLAAAVLRMAQDAELRNSKRSNSAASAHLYSRERQAADTLRVLHKAISDERAGVRSSVASTLPVADKSSNNTSGPAAARSSAE